MQEQFMIQCSEGECQLAQKPNFQDQRQMLMPFLNGNNNPKNNSKSSLFNNNCFNKYSLNDLFDIINVFK